MFWGNILDGLAQSKTATKPDKQGEYINKEKNG